MIAMKLIGLVANVPTDLDGKYLVEYDPSRDGVAPDGSPMDAHIVVTDDLSKAKEFADLDEFHSEWVKIDRRIPIRQDGHPNRPLTAFSVLSVPTNDNGLEMLLRGKGSQK